MSNKIFAENIRKRLDEQFGFGTKNQPVQELSFPDTTPVKSPETTLPSDNQTVVTNGETTPITEPREDLNAQKQGGTVNPEALGEISSLLVSIGYILSKESIVPDKFDTAAIVNFLNTHFKKVDPVTMQPPTDNACGEVAQVTAIMPSQYENPQVNAIYEARQLLDKKLKSL